MWRNPLPEARISLWTMTSCIQQCYTFHATLTTRQNLRHVTSTSGVRGYSSVMGMVLELSTTKTWTRLSTGQMKRHTDGGCVVLPYGHSVRKTCGFGRHSRNRVKE